MTGHAESTADNRWQIAEIEFGTRIVDIARRPAAGSLPDEPAMGHRWVPRVAIKDFAALPGRIREVPNVRCRVREGRIGTVGQIPNPTFGA